MGKIVKDVLLGIRTMSIIIAYGFFSLFMSAREYKGYFPEAHRWYKLRLPVESAHGSDGSPYSVYLKKGLSNDLVVFFSGGGVSWNEYTAARPLTPLRVLSGGDAYYFPGVRNYHELLNGGILAANDAHNPFNDWNYILLPYATGDFHTGNNEFRYRDAKGRDRVLHHCGAQNVRTALEAVKSVFENPEQLLIAGESAGAFGCVALAPAIGMYFPDCKRITVYSDSAQLFCPKWKEIVRDVWKADPSLSDCIESGNLILDWFEWLYQKMGDGVKYLQYCSLYDEVLSVFQNKMNNDVFALDKRALTEFNIHLKETLITLSRMIPNYHYFLSEQDKKEEDGSTAHTASRYKIFYNKTPPGISVADWLNDAINSDKLYNIGEELLTRTGEK